MNIAQRILNMTEPALLEFYPLVDRVEEAGKKIYRLNIGQPDFKTPETFMKRVNALKNQVLGYSQPEGEKNLREEACRYYARYGLYYEPEDILVTNGGSEALMFTFFTVCNPGDEIIMPEPMYSIYKQMAAAASVKLVGIMTHAEDGFALPKREEIEKLVTDRTRAILINTPGNPTGRIYTREEIEALRDIALEHDLYLLSDEVYREFVYEGERYISPGHYPELEQNCVILDSISKRYSACGARIGFIVSKNHDLMYQIRKLCQMRLAVSTVDQAVAAELLDLGLDFFDDILAEYGKRREIVWEAMQRMDGVIGKKPAGAFYYMLKLPVDDARDFIRWMITDFEYEGATVLLSPANDFYTDPKNGRDEVRLAYVLKEDDLKCAMKCLEEGLKAYNHKNN